LSNRSEYPFIPINCAAIPKELVESILFGHRKGAFTGAISDRTGKFDAAHTGTLFLDELAELPVSTQSKLLRVLQDGMVEPLGSAKPHKVDVRVVAATNQDIKEAIKTGNFRQDLYYRLNVGEIRLPPLRERKSDIPKIALYVLERINHSLKNQKRLSTGALRKLQDYPWYGNARELENAIERSVRLSQKTVLEAEDLLIPEPIGVDNMSGIVPEPGFSIEEYLSTSRKALINKAMELAGGNRSEAARLLGISPQAVHKFLKTDKK
jgi:transcriptional regulator with PAS, ATPase and Fis domain